MDNDQIQYDVGDSAPARREQKSGGLNGLMIRMGLAKDAEQANKVMMIILAICIVVGVGVWFVL